MYTQALATLFSFKERWQYLTERQRKRVEAARAEASPAGTDPLSYVKLKFEQATMAAVRCYSPGRMLLEPHVPAKAERFRQCRENHSAELAP